MDYVLFALAVIGGIVTLNTLGRLAGDRYTATIGRRRDHYRRLRLLSVNVQIDYLSTVLDQPPALKIQTALTTYGEGSSSYRLGWEYIWVDRWYYVSARAFDSGPVLGFTVTSRDGKFRPRFAFPHHRGALAAGTVLKSTFSQLTDSPTAIFATTGAHSFSYAETFHLGNPGFFQTFILASNQAGADCAAPSLVKLEPDGSVAGNFSLNSMNAEHAAYWTDPSLKRFRETARINSYGVCSSDFPPEKFDPSFWPNYETVRVVP